MNLRNKRVVWIAGMIIAAFIVALYFDSPIIRGVSYLKDGLLDEIFLGLTFISSTIIIFFLLTSLFLWSENKRKWILPLWFTLLLSSIVGFILKVSIQRLRPFQLGLINLQEFLMKNSYTALEFSIPSNHALLAFCALPILSKEFPKLKYVWLALACLIGFSRIYFGFHFLSDVIAGATIGYLIGFAVVKAEKEGRFWEKVYWRIYDKFVK